jgi:hypothetical protein
VPLDEPRRDAVARAAVGDLAEPLVDLAAVLVAWPVVVPLGMENLVTTSDALRLPARVAPGRATPDRRLTVQNPSS